jgi:hypothetical protein
MTQQQKHTGTFEALLLAFLHEYAGSKSTRFSFYNDLRYKPRRIQDPIRGVHRLRYSFGSRLLSGGISYGSRLCLEATSPSVSHVCVIGRVLCMIHVQLKLVLSAVVDMLGFPIDFELVLIVPWEILHAASHSNGPHAI